MEKQRWEESEKRREEKRREKKKKKEEQRRERVRGKKMQAREKIEKLRNTMFSNDLWRRRAEKKAR